MRLRRFLVFVMLVLAAGCRSDAERLADLRQREAIARLTVLRYERVRDSLWGELTKTGANPYGPGALQASWQASVDSAAAAQDSLLLVERDLARFMKP